MAAVSPTVGSATTLGFLGGRSTFSDGFLLEDGWAWAVALRALLFLLGSLGLDVSPSPAFFHLCTRVDG